MPCRLEGKHTADGAVVAVPGWGDFPHVTAVLETGERLTNQNEEMPLVHTPYPFGAVAG